MSDKFCSGTKLPGFGVLSQCVPIASCPKILENSYAPTNQTEICGFDTDVNQLMICCPEDMVETPKVRYS